MLNRLLCALLLVGLVASRAVAQPAAPEPGNVPTSRVAGRIDVERVRGTVNATNTATGETKQLHDHDQLTEKYSVATVGTSSVVLVFSNGATVDVGADSVLNIEQFEQDPFSTSVSVKDLTREPATSVTKLNLTRGELVGKVVHLNTDQGSSFTVLTPVGAAGIRGTTFQITFRPGGNGKAYFSVSTAEGQVIFSGVLRGSAAVAVNSGKQVVVANIDVPTGPAAGGGTPGAPGGGTPGGTPAPTTTVTLVTTDIPPAQAAVIQTAAANIADAVAASSSFTPTPTNTGNSSSGSGTSGSSSGSSSSGTASGTSSSDTTGTTNSTTNNTTQTSSTTTSTTPSQPTNTPPATTPGAGGP
jgi:hypothetical protein